MGRRISQYVDPYLTKLKQLEHQIIAYAVLSGFAACASFFVTQFGADAASGALSAIVWKIRYTVAMAFLLGCGLSATFCLILAARYIYLAKWPERFRYPD